MNDIPSEKQLWQGRPQEKWVPVLCVITDPTPQWVFDCLFLPIDCSLLEDKECILILS